MAATIFFKDLAPAAGPLPLCSISIKSPQKTVYDQSRESNLVRYMLVRILFAILMVCFVCCQKKQKTPFDTFSFKGPFPDTISIMEYNVENLFDIIDNGTEYPEFKPNTCNWTLSTFQIKLGNIASVIAAINADIAVLVEIENENALKALLSVLREKNCPYYFFALGDKPNRTITVPVILSKFPLFEIKTYGSPIMGDTALSRNLLEANVFLGKDTLKVFACHWPSKREHESKRIAAAELLKSRLMKLPRNADYIIAGDFNENYDECATFHTLGLDDSYGVTGINHILGTLRSQSGTFTDFVTKKTILDTGKLRHFDPWLDLPEEKRMSEIYKHQKNTLDHILLGPGLFDTSGLSYSDRSFRVFTWDGRLMYKDAPFRWQMRYEKTYKYHRGEGYSDHLPIVARLHRGPFQSETPESVASVPKKEGSSIKTIGFESGLEGWVPCAPYVSLRRDTGNTHSGLYCLKISGSLGKQNGCAAHAIIPCRLADDSLLHWCSMNIRGSGVLSFRIRPVKSKKWTYFNGEDFKFAKGAKYTSYEFKDWKELRLPLAFEDKIVKEIDVEIRTKKENSMELWIDDILIK
jgi:hypothetical protein